MKETVFGEEARLWAEVITDTPCRAGLQGDSHGAELVIYGVGRFIRILLHRKSTPFKCRR
jgi:hypothetical protein